MVIVILFGSVISISQCYDISIILCVNDIGAVVFLVSSCVVYGIIFSRNVASSVVTIILPVGLHLSYILITRAWATQQLCTVPSGVQLSVNVSFLFHFLYLGYSAAWQMGIGQGDQAVSRGFSIWDVWMSIGTLAVSVLRIFMICFSPCRNYSGIVPYSSLWPLHSTFFPVHYCSAIWCYADGGSDSVIK